MFYHWIYYISITAIVSITVKVSITFKVSITVKVFITAKVSITYEVSLPAGGEEFVMCGCKERNLVQAWRLHRHDHEDIKLNLPKKTTALATPPGKATVMVAGK